MSPINFLRLIFLLSAVEAIVVSATTPTPTAQGEDLETERCSCVNLDTYTRQVETGWTISNIFPAWGKLEDLNETVTKANFSRRLLNLDWDFELELQESSVMIRTNVEMLQREWDETINKIRIRFVVNTVNETKRSEAFKDLYPFGFLRGSSKGHFLAYSFIEIKNEDFVSLRDIISLNVTAELVYAKAVQYQALDCQITQEMSANLPKSSNTSHSQGLGLPSPSDKIPTVYKWTMEKPLLKFTSYSNVIAETGGFRVGYDDQLLSWEVKLEILKANHGTEAYLHIYDRSINNLKIVDHLNVNATVLVEGVGRNMTLDYRSPEGYKYRAFKTRVSDDDLKEWEESLTVVMTFDPAASTHSTTEANDLHY